MFSKILVKLIDQAIVPAILLLAVRFVSVILISRQFQINIDMTAAGFNLPAESYLLVNSYSILFMVCTLTVGLLYILLKSFIFHESHITPALTARVFSLRLSTFIQDSFDLYSQGTIWLSYLYLLALVSGTMVVFNLVYLWVFIVAVVLSVIATVFFVLDIENELDLRQSDTTYSQEEVVLDFGGRNE